LDLSDYSIDIRILSAPVSSFWAFFSHAGLYAGSSGGDAYRSTPTSSARHHTNIGAHKLLSSHQECSST
jgi:hypothetical protein